MTTETATAEAEAEAAEHQCAPGKFKVFYRGPVWPGERADGQEYLGEHAHWEGVCTTCEFVVTREGHNGHCYDDMEIGLFDAHWYAKDEVFVHGPDWSTRFDDERREAIAAYYMGEGPRPEPWAAHTQRQRSKPTANRVNRKRGR